MVEMQQQVLLPLQYLLLLMVVMAVELMQTVVPKLSEAVKLKRVVVRVELLPLVATEQIPLAQLAVLVELELTVVLAVLVLYRVEVVLLPVVAVVVSIMAIAEQVPLLLVALVLGDKLNLLAVLLAGEALLLAPQPLIALQADKLE